MKVCTEPSVAGLVERVRGVLSDDLLKPEYRAIEGRAASAGHCYVACEVLFHVLGGKGAGLKPMQVRHEGSSHWFLCTPWGWVDPTADQFVSAVPYELGVGRGLLTRLPSKRAVVVLERLGLMPVKR